MIKAAINGLLTILDDMFAIHLRIIEMPEETIILIRPIDRRGGGPTLGGLTESWDGLQNVQ